MKSHQRIAAYRERLIQWTKDPMRAPSNKPTPESFGITSAPEMFVAGKIHDSVLAAKFPKDLLGQPVDPKTLPVSERSLEKQ